MTAREFEDRYVGRSVKVVGYSDHWDGTVGKVVATPGANYGCVTISRDDDERLAFPVQFLQLTKIEPLPLPG